MQHNQFVALKHAKKERLLELKPLNNQLEVLSDDIIKSMVQRKCMSEVVDGVKYTIKRKTKKLTPDAKQDLVKYVLENIKSEWNQDDICCAIVKILDSKAYKEDEYTLTMK